MRRTAADRAAKRAQPCRCRRRCGRRADGGKEGGDTRARESSRGSRLNFCNGDVAVLSRQRAEGSDISLAQLAKAFERGSKQRSLNYHSAFFLGIAQLTEEAIGRGKQFIAQPDAARFGLQLL